jgi:hypothetical protein
VRANVLDQPAATGGTSAEPTQPDPAQPAANGQGQAPANEGQPKFQSVEEADEFWRKRVGNKDKAHAAAERALREENESLKRQLQTTPPAGQAGGEGGGDPAVAQLRQQLQQNQQLLEQERQQRVIDTRKAKYPKLVEQGLPDAMFAAGDEASLAKLNALADDEPEGTLIAPTGPRRASAAASKPIREKSKEELLADLRVVSDRMMEQRRSPTGF